MAQLSGEQVAAIAAAAKGMAAPRTFNQYAIARRCAEILDLPLLVVVSSETCAPCRRLEAWRQTPVVRAELDGYVVCELDIAHAAIFDVEVVPTQLIIYRGKVRVRQVGSAGIGRPEQYGLLLRRWRNALLPTPTNVTSKEVPK